MIDLHIGKYDNITFIIFFSIFNIDKYVMDFSFKIDVYKLHFEQTTDLVIIYKIDFKLKINFIRLKFQSHFTKFLELGKLFK